MAGLEPEGRNGNSRAPVSAAGGRVHDIIAAPAQFREHALEPIAQALEHRLTSFNNRQVRDCTTKVEQTERQELDQAQEAWQVCVLRSMPLTETGWCRGRRKAS